jgi:hypothetical protein
MANTIIQVRKSAVPGNTPISLAAGELAINYADGKLFYKDVGGTIKYIGGNQSTFATINSNNQLILATSPTDILNIVPGTNITFITDTVSKTITINSTSSNIQPAFDRANAAYSEANAVYTLANNSSITSNLAFSEANTAALFGNGAFVTANSAASFANGAFIQANSSYTEANSAYSLAQAAFNKANTGGSGGGATYLTVQDNGTTISNTVNTINFIGTTIQSFNSGNGVNITVSGGGNNGFPLVDLGLISDSPTANDYVDFGTLP